MHVFAVLNSKTEKRKEKQAKNKQTTNKQTNKQTNKNKTNKKLKTQDLESRACSSSSSSNQTTRIKITSKAEIMKKDFCYGYAGKDLENDDHANDGHMCL